MKLMNCPRCGRLIKDEGDGEILCSKCALQQGDPYKKVRDYIYAHQGATIMDVATATGISETLILKYLKEGRLSLLETKSMLNHCEKCGVVIEKGYICGSCMKEELEIKEQKSYGTNKSTTSGFGRRRRR
ncbi:hypothetical protein SAMN05660297_00735 [Natronincola peptidivorans]|uniref:Flagellar operon protein TIGR03826 n=1 Tax=Natronincola peptidivorans TaxID=426128 RepID=A0A1H9ZUR4_9FIRM|nr:hypothetical protein [Natronincola peptidivorans]SES85513.1 hypothetical protein SAMN05660297_00735 [Natronincola peptidivorans]